MEISELQYNGEMENTPDELLAIMERQFKEGFFSESTYHSQLAIIYSVHKRLEESRYHASLVPETAEVLDRVEVHFALARMLVFENKIPEAIEEYLKTVRLNGEYGAATEELGRCYYHEKDFVNAEKWLLKATGDLDTLESLWGELGLAVSHQEKYAEAIGYFEKAKSLQTEPVSDDYYEYVIGLCYANLGDFYRALAHYTKCLDANPVHGQALNNMATLYFEHEADIKTAIDYLKKAEEVAEADEDNSLLQQVCINLIRLYNMTKEFDLKDLYNNKLLMLLGFPSMFDEYDDEEDDGFEFDDED